MKSCSISLIIREMHKETPPHTCRKGCCQKTRDDKCCWNMGKGDPVNCWWGQNWVQLLWKTVLRFLKKLKMELLFDPATLLLGRYPKKMKAGPQRDICTPMFAAALFTRHWNNLAVHQQINGFFFKVAYIHTMQYYWAIRKKEILPFVTTWMDPEDMTLSEIS